MAIDTISFFGRGVAVLTTCFVAITAACAGEFVYHQKIPNDPSRCARSGPAVKVRISGIAPARGILRMQLYRGTSADWLKKGRWLTRIEVPAHDSTSTVCMPVSGPGTYGIAVRHDVNGNGETDLRTDGGGMSNNPAISIFNLGRPSIDKTAFRVDDSVKSITIQMRYF